MKPDTYRHVVNKVRNTRGETISETLVALLIASLALVMLAGAITAANSIVRKSRDKLDDYYTANEVMVTMPANTITSTSTSTSNSNSTGIIRSGDTTATVNGLIGSNNVLIEKGITYKKNTAFSETGEKAVVTYKLKKNNP